MALGELAPERAGKLVSVIGYTNAAIWRVSCGVVAMLAFVAHPITVNSLRGTI